MARFHIIGAAALIAAAGQAGAEIVLLEDFEDAAIGYVASPADDLGDIATYDYFGRIAPDTASPPAGVAYGNRQGEGYFGVQDSDSVPGGPDSVQLDWTGIDIAGFTGLTLSWYVAEADAINGDEDWDGDTAFRIEAQLDGGGFVPIFGIAGTGPDTAPRVDTDLDGIGDGAEITALFTQYSASIADGALLDIRVRFDNLDAGDEDLAFDSLRLEGDLPTAAVPLPASLPLAGLGLLALGALARRRRRRQAENA
ncbi:hypothetical protein LNKW23_47610 [Paralimibaculum aggregatum]|uniref:PEP-CTERM sorting domain-containing protein n=1 Tax=Paralimibaculum aggregatum TaxID=3036245 RepID=A0ABQ6LTW4_9RHOB|nr:hypothetical protein [Limibaculum sp. NKW23]GMG85538.1 hypothetical protein LNKW23_47610 [Limibaculum sp. NKW23]